MTSSHPAGGRSKYATIRRGERPGLRDPEAPALPLKINSGFEADVSWLLYYWQRQGYVLYWEKERWIDYAPGKEDSKNRVLRLDYFVILRSRDRRHAPQGVRYCWLEVKGFLEHGGRLDRLDIESLQGRDDASYQKLKNYRRWHPERAGKTWVIGAADLRRLGRRYKALIPQWESDAPKPFAVQLPAAIPAAKRSRSRAKVAVTEIP